MLSATPGHIRNDLVYTEYALPDRSFLAGSVRNKTRITTRFSSPGGFETTSRGHLDPAHETFSQNNALTFRNAWTRKVFNSQLQAHCGLYGVSTHEATVARVYGSEAVGVVRGEDYALVGDAAKHKYHRNNTERIEFTGDEATSKSAVFVTASFFDNAFVSHMIPRTDQQTRWITGSII